MTKVFIYGSLKKGFYNHLPCRMDEGEFLGEASVSGAQLFSLGAYPCVILTADEADKIHGEVYELPDHIVAPIDEMELGAGYVKKQIRTSISSDEKNDTLIYVYRGERLEDLKSRRVESGKWIQ